jgi:tetratricopeptide (TPR) repeat protein/energy-coupling factor transporter ATP-binding protein EcfA2
MTRISDAPPTADRARVGEQPPAAAADSTLSAARPFPGLRPFAYADRAFFCGRESQALALYRLVTEGRFVAVVGSSGSGKSSLAMAGLCDLIEQETEDANGPSWVWTVMRPGGSPIRRLAEAMAQFLAGDEASASELRERFESRLRQSSFSLANAIDEAGGLGGRRLLLIVDQFEELFRFGLAGLGHGGLGVLEAKAREEATLFVQILLDARRLANLRILITMRSDFIGDCAHFAGLPEAVSATQYLVPALTRSQLEEVIRHPIEMAGGTVEPELVERLLNDCGDELDQLPVLQHCLMRLWDQAGADSSIGGARHLTRLTYDAIGRMVEALSRHADEVFRQCAGKELAVEQAFRALSELDKEGRAIRRGRRFAALLDETGVSEADLRAVLDRFRAPTCSFLIPPLSVPLKEGDFVDIGHEALLRCWRTLAGDGLAKTAAAPSGRLGWLAEERADGERYRTLVGLVGGEKANLTAPEETKRWWDGRPRTKEWAERYGGRFETVRRLIDDSIAAKKRSLEEERRLRRNRNWAAAFAVIGVVLTAAALWIMLERQKQREIAQQEKQERLRLEVADTSAMRSAKTLLESVRGAYNNQSLDRAGLESLAKISGQFLKGAREARKTSAADLLWAQALNVEADLHVSLDKDEESLAEARAAKEAALALIRADPKALEPLQALYDASIRAGNALAVSDASRRTEALQEYQNAIGVAEKIATSGVDNDAEGGDNEVIDGHIKVGDIYRDRGQTDKSEAEYRLALAACETALAKRPQSAGHMRNKGKAYYRIADLLRTQNALAEARDDYRQAADIQDALIRRNAEEAIGARKPVDLSLKSNLAATSAHWGLLERKAGDLNLALAKLRQGASLNEELIKAQPGVLQWQDSVAPNYVFIAEILEGLGRPKDALDYYHKYLDAKRILAFRGLGPPKAQKEFAAAAKLVGDRSNSLDQIDAYRSATWVFGRMIDDPNAADSAADQFDLVSGLAGVFDAKKDWPDAQTAHRVAMKIAVFNYVKNPEDTSWRDKAEAAEKALVEAQTAAEGKRADAPR